MALLFLMALAMPMPLLMQLVTIIYDREDTENKTMAAMHAAVTQAQADGMSAVRADMTTVAACVEGSDKYDHCGGSSEHLGMEGHENMRHAAWPMLAKRMGWKSDDEGDLAGIFVPAEPAGGEFLQLLGEDIISRSFRDDKGLHD